MDRLGLKWLHPANHFYCQPSCNNNPVGFHESTKKATYPSNPWVRIGESEPVRESTQPNLRCKVRAKQNRFIIQNFEFAKQEFGESLQPSSQGPEGSRTQPKKTNKQSRKVAVDALQGIKDIFFPFFINFFMRINTYINLSLKVCENRQDTNKKKKLNRLQKYRIFLIFGPVQ